MYLNSFRKWLRGQFTCKKCGEEYKGLFFGFGEIVCPDCYQEDQQFLFLDNSYWLNRFITRLYKQKLSEPAPHFHKPVLYKTPPFPEIAQYINEEKKPLTQNSCARAPFLFLFLNNYPFLRVLCLARAPRATKLKL